MNNEGPVYPPAIIIELREEYNSPLSSYFNEYHRSGNYWIPEWNGIIRDS